MFVRLLLGLLCVLGSAHFADASPFAYFGNYSGSGRVSAIDLNTNNISHIALSGAQAPYGVAVNSFGSRVYVTDKVSAKVFVIDTATNAVTSLSVTNIPSGLAVNTAGTRLYLANAGNGTVTMLDLADGSEKNVGAGNSPDGIAVVTVNPATDEDRVYVTNKGSNTVSVYTATDGSIAKLGSDITTGSSPAGIALIPAINRAYVANTASGNVTVINTADNTFVTNVSVGSMPFGVAVAPNGLKAYVTLSGIDDKVAVIDTSNNQLLPNDAIAVGPSPMGLAFTTDGAKLVVVNNLGPSISIYNGTNVTTLPLGGDSPQAFGKFVGPEFVAITLNAGAFGSITPKDPITMDTTTKKILVPKNSSVGLNVTPIPNFRIDTVTLDGAVFPYPYTIANANADKVVAATFVREKYNVSVVQSPTGGGTVIADSGAVNCGSTCSGSYPIGTTVILSQTASPGYLFLGWSGSSCSGTSTCRFTTDGIYADVYGTYNVKAIYKQYTQFQTVYDYASDGTTISAGVSYTSDPVNSFTASAGKNIYIKPAYPSTTLNLSTTTTTGKFSITGRYDKITILSGIDAGTFIIQ